MNIPETAGGRRRHADDSLVDNGPETKEPGRCRPRQFADWRQVPEKAFEQGEIRAAIDQALNGLPEIYREIFILRDVEHFNELLVGLNNEINR